MTDENAELREDFEAAGLLDADAPNAEQMLELLDYLVEEVGASIPELVQATEQGGLLSFGAFRTLRAGREVYTLAEASAAAGMDQETALNVWRCAGFADPRPFERRFGPHDVEMFQLLQTLSAFVSVDAVLQLVRTMGEAIGRVAEAEVALLRSDVEAPLVEDQKLVEVARAYIDVANDVFPRIHQTLDTLHRHHLQAIGRRYSDVGAPPSALNVVQLAVGFADLAGYTGMWQERSPHELADMLARFEATTGDVIVAARANVVKRIGDAVMFVTNAPGVACGLALELLEACAAAGLPKLRVGLAFGDVMVRHGDFYGATVNLAARLVTEAEAGTALTDKEMADRLARVRGSYAFLAAGKYNLAGFVEPIEAYQLLRP
jgi:class 3 adenylate cyclase